jgi:LacI family transcriptional regulator
VSIATVSRALNGRPDVAPGTREAVLRVAREQGFSTQREPREPDPRRAPITLMLPRTAHASLQAMLQGVIAAADEGGLRTLLTTGDRELSLRELMQHNGTAGLILVLPENAAIDLRELQDERFPVVVVDPRERPPEGIPFVAAMHAAGARSAIEHLLELGHRRIGAIVASPGSYPTEERLIGLRTAYAHAGLALERELIVESDASISGGRTAAGSILSLADPPTALFGLDDHVTLGAVHAARDRGLHTPRDLSIIGFAEPEQAELIAPQLTAVTQPRAEIGRMSIALLTRLIEGQAVDAIGLELSTKLVIRESTAPRRTT